MRPSWLMVRGILRGFDVCYSVFFFFFNSLRVELKSIVFKNMATEIVEEVLFVYTWLSMSLRVNRVRFLEDIGF